MMLVCPDGYRYHDVILMTALKCYPLKCSLQEHQEQIYFAMFEKADISTEQHCSFEKLRLISKGLYTSHSSRRTAKYAA